MCDGGGGGGDGGGAGDDGNRGAGFGDGGFLLSIPPRWSIDVARLIEAKPYTTEELFVSISNSIKQHLATIESHKNLYWKTIHLFLKKPDPNIISIDGMRLRQLYEFFDAFAPAKINVGQAYDVRLAELERTVSATLATLSQMQK